MHDVVVIGGGPAGALTADRLAARGHDVLLVEEHTDIGQPVHCTGLVGDEAFEEFALPRETILGHAGAARFWGASGESVLVASDTIRAAVIDRALFDARLADRAAASGVTIKRGWRAEAIDVESGRVRVTGRGFTHAVEARAGVLACGANYRFHKRLGLGVPSVFLQSAQIETPFPAMPEVQIRLGRQVAPGGFGWLVPVERGGVPHARIGLMAASQSRQRFRTFADELAMAAGVPADTIAAPRLKMLPLSPVARTFASRVVAVGDAAGLVKPTTGGGIYYGLVSGAIAADVLDTALVQNQLDERTLSRYETLWRRQLGPDIRAGLAFRKIAGLLGDAAIDSVIELAKVNGVVPLLQQTASFNSHRKAALALLADPSFRRIVLQSWRRGVGLA